MEPRARVEVATCRLRRVCFQSIQFGRNPALPALVGHGTCNVNCNESCPVTQLIGHSAQISLWCRSNRGRTNELCHLHCRHFSGEGGRLTGRDALQFLIAPAQRQIPPQGATIVTGKGPSTLAGRIVPPGTGRPSLQSVSSEWSASEVNHQECCLPPSPC